MVENSIFWTYWVVCCECNDLHKNPNIPSTRRALQRSVSSLISTNVVRSKRIRHGENTVVFTPSWYKEWFILKEKNFPVSTPKSVKCGYEKNQSKKCKDKKTSNFCDKWSMLQWNFLSLS